MAGMEIVFVSGLACSGKSFLTKALVWHLRPGRAARLPVDHYYLDANCPEHRDLTHTSGYHRDRFDWALLFSHITDLQSGVAIQTPRYDWENWRRVPRNSGIGRTVYIEPREILFLDSMYPSFDVRHKHIYICPKSETQLALIQLRASQMPLPATPCFSK